VGSCSAVCSLCFFSSVPKFFGLNLTSLKSLGPVFLHLGKCGKASQNILFFFLKKGGCCGIHLYGIRDKFHDNPPITFLYIDVYI
jgi:hypothetical protein